MHRLLALAALAACTREPSPCTRQIAELRGWLAQLARDGLPAPVPHGLQLAALAAPPVPTPSVDAPRLIMHPDELVFEGRLVATGRWTDPAPLGEELKAAARDELVVIADASIPWSEVAAVATTAERTGVRRFAFVFRADRRGAPPPPSTIDRDVAALGGVVLDHAPLVDRVLERCPAARALPRDDVRAFADRLVPAIEACGCAVELPAVQRLVWTAWQRDNPDTVQTTAGVAIAPAGTPVALAGATRWDAAAPRVLAAARGGAVHLTSDR